MVGDFNADALDLSNVAWNHLLNVTSCHNLRNYVCEPTRITPSSKTCLDLLFSTSDLTPVSTHVVETHCSDHCMIVGEFNVCLPAPPPTRVSLCRSWHQFDTHKFINTLQHSHLDVFDPASDIDQLWSEWHTKFMHALDLCTPLKLKRERRKKCAWMNNELLSLIHKRRFLYCKGKISLFNDADIFLLYRRI